MKQFLILPTLALLLGLFFVGCEKHLAAYEHGEKVAAVIVKKYETGSNNPTGKGPRKNYYFDVQVPADNSIHRINSDKVTWNNTEVGETVLGYFHEGTFAPAFTELEK